MISVLIQLKWVQQTQANRYMLSRDLNQMTLNDLAQHLPYKLPGNEQLALAPVAPWTGELISANEHLAATFTTSLHDLFTAGLENVAGQVFIGDQQT